MHDVLQSGYYESSFGYNNVDWLVYVVRKSQNKVSSFCQITEKDTIMTEKKNEKHHRNTDICQFCGTKKFLGSI